MAFLIGILLGLAIGSALTWMVMRGDSARDQLAGVDRRGDLMTPPPPPMPNPSVDAPAATASSTAADGEPDPVTRQKALDLTLTGNKIAAIKLVRERTGQGLAEAKATVERIERQSEGRL